MLMNIEAPNFIVYIYLMKSQTHVHTDALYKALRIE